MEQSVQDAALAAVSNRTAEMVDSTSPSSISDPTTTTEPLVPSKRDEMLAKLHQTSLDRAAATDAARHLRHAAAPFSSHTNTGLQAEVDAFLTSFSSSTSRLTHLILSLSTPLTPTLLSPIHSGLSSLHSSLNHAAHFLPPHDLRTSQAAVAQLEELLGRQRDTLQPKKRFAFRSRQLKAASASSSPSPSLISSPSPVHPSPSPAPSPLSSSPAAPAPVLTGFHGLSHRTLVLPPSRLHRDLHLSHLTHCRIVLPSLSSSLHLTHLTHCQLLSGPVTGPVHLTSCHSSTFHLACHQLRIHHSTHLTLHLFASSTPIIEHSSHITFDPTYRLRYPHHTTDWAEAGMQGRRNAAAVRVEDFNWLRVQQSPNWRYAAEGELHEGEELVGEEEAGRDDSNLGVGFD